LLKKSPERTKRTDSNRNPTAENSTYTLTAQTAKLLMAEYTESWGAHDLLPFHYSIAMWLRILKAMPLFIFG
jgi:hypothetical protein